MKKILPLATILILLLLLFQPVSADAFSSWSAYGDAWKATNDTFTLIKWNSTGNHKFVTDGNASIINSTLVVAGGAGGGSNWGGGGGAGGLLYITEYAISGTVNITVGDGGIGGVGTAGVLGTNGQNSTFNNITVGDGINAKGGGLGGQYKNGVGGLTPLAGGSGGGGVYATYLTGAAGVAGQGNNGGNSVNTAPYRGGGGGGAGGVGSNGGSGTGVGGIGLPITITGTSITFSTGGTGGNTTSGLGADATDETGNGGDGGGQNFDGGDGGSGVVIVLFKSPAGGSAPTAAFTDNRLFRPYELASIQFTDTSTDSPTSWCWTFIQDGNSSETIFAPNTQNPVYDFSNGTYVVSLNVTNAWGNDTISSAPFTVYLADNFTQVSNPSNPESLVAFVPNATSPRTVFNWTFGDLGAGNTSTNATADHRYGVFGDYSVKLLAESPFGSSTTTLWHRVTNLSGVNSQDIEMEPQFTLTVHITDSATGAAIPVNTITLSDGQTSDTTNGTAIFTVAYDTIVVYVSSEGYRGTSVSYLMDRDREETIQLSDESDYTPDFQSYPHYVTFHLKEGFGEPLSDVEVSVIGVSTSTGNWDFIMQLLGLPLDEIPINGTFMNQTTDSLGRATFFLIPTGKYNITFTKTGYTITPMVLVPQDENYVIFATEVDDLYYRDGVDEISTVNISITTTRISDTVSFINVTYNDTSLKTTGGTIQVLQKSDQPWSANTVMATWPVTGNSFSNGTAITHTQQVSGYVSANISHSEFGYVARSYPYGFDGVPVQFLGFGQEIALLVALGMMVFTLMLAGAAHVRPILFLVGIEGWIFYTVRWFESLIDRGVSHEAIWLALSILLIMAALANFEVRKKKEKY